MSHLTSDRRFKSDKYEWCPVGFFALKLSDPRAWGPLLTYAANATHDPALGHELEIAVLAEIERQRVDCSYCREVLFDVPGKATSHCLICDHNICPRCADGSIYRTMHKDCEEGN